MKNSQIEDLLKSAVKNNKVINGYIFSGSRKTENYDYAIKFAKMILCEDIENAPCGFCKSCISFDDNNHSDFYEINKDSSESIKIDEIREMQNKVIEKPITSKHKVYVINNAENMTKEAQNSLLKTLEEPPSFVTIVLVVNNESSILNTIKSRCSKVVFTEEKIDSLSEEQKTRYKSLEEVFGNVDKYLSIDLLNKLDILYKDKDNILENLEFINTIFFEKAKENKKYLNYIDVVEETKIKINSSCNFDMCIDNLILKIWE